MESLTKNRQPRERIEQMAQRAFGVRLAPTADAVAELTEGWFNVVYLVTLADRREVVLKIAPPQDAEVMTYERNLMATEIAAMRLVESNPGVPVPHIHFADETTELCDAPWFFMDRLAGVNFGHVGGGLAPETVAALRFRTGEIIREVNTFTGTTFGYPGHPGLQGDSWRSVFTAIVGSVLDDGLAKDVVLEPGYDAIRAALDRHGPALDEVTTPVLVHWDAWDSNFFVLDDEITGLLDFERALWGDPLMEAQFRPLYGDGVSDAMRGYGKTEFTFAEQQRCHLYTLHLGLVMNVECAYRHYDTDAVAQISAVVIARSMEWLEKN